MPAHLTKVVRVLLVVSLLGVASAAALPPGCTGSSSLGTFQLLVRPFSQGEPLQLKSLAAVPGGARLIWNPVRLMAQASDEAEVAAVLVPASDGVLLTLEPRKAKTRTEWQLPETPQVLALIYGPQGLSEGKIKSLVTRNQELLKQLAHYAEESSEVESLVQQLADAEQAGGGTDAVLKGFSSKYGVAPPKLDTRAPSDQQASLLLQALIPSAGAYDPLASTSGQIQQTGGLAASVAGLFFGNPVGLAAGGTVLFQNLKTALFPSTEFRSAFVQAADQDDLALCTKSAAAKAKTRPAYLWAYSVPALKMPAVSLAGETHLPLGSTSAVAFKAGGKSAVQQLGKARDWRLVPVSGGVSFPVGVKISKAADSVDIDLSQVRVPGDYRLSASWDWDTLPVDGTLHLHPYGDLHQARFAPGARDRLVAGNASVTVELTGTDFEFLEKVSVESAAHGTKPADIDFTLPRGKRAGPQASVAVTVDTDKPGLYRLLLAQSDGVTGEIPFTVLPPNPRISNVPLRINLGETSAPVQLLGSGLERIEAVTCDAGAVSGAPGPQSWVGAIAVKPGLVQGQKFALHLKVQGLENPVTVPDAVEVVGPRPRIQSVRKSLPGALGTEIGSEELPAGAAVGLALTVDHLREAGRPRVELGCATGELRQALALSAGQPSGAASLAFAGPGALYLSVDPGAVGYAGCRLAATVVQDPEGRSDSFVLGNVIRVPRLDKFTLTTEKVGDSSYAAVLEGRDLDVIEKSGWDAAHGVPVEAIPAPVAGDPVRQTLRVVLPWPSPFPHAPLYVWLRGEDQGRKTTVTY